MNAERETPRPGPRIQGIVTALQAPGTPDELAEEDYYLRLYDSVGCRAGKSLRPIVIGGRAAAASGTGTAAPPHPKPVAQQTHGKAGKQTHGKAVKAAKPHHTKKSKPGKAHAKGKSASHGHPTKAAL